MKCKDCKFWRRNTDSDPVFMGDCSSDKFVYATDDEPEKDGLSYGDYEEYSAFFSTGEDFGCIHFEEKQ